MIDSIIVHPDPKRDAAAEQLAVNAALWPVVTLKQAHHAFPAGTVFYAVPSRSNPGASYLANRVFCQCKDYKRTTCAHIRAVIIFEGRIRQVPPRRKYTDLFGVCEVRGCDDERERGELFCERHQLVDAY